MNRRRWIVAAGLALALLVGAGVYVAKRDLSSRVTVAGNFQAALGCSSDWQPGCGKTGMAEQPDGSWTRDLALPAGSYEFKIAIGSDWTESYGGANGANLPLSLPGPATVRFAYDPATHAIAVAPTEAGPAPEASLAATSVRPDGTGQQFYFVMTDRFANGDPTNDTGGLTGDRGVTGFDPTDVGYYHGGDLRGLTDKLDYIAGLGTTAIWITPPFVNRAVQGTGTDASAGYHGYWITDFTRIDPHLGTNEDMTAFIAAAHAKGMKVYFDVVVNHTADVIAYEGGQRGYVSKTDRPYQDSSGQKFDDTAYARGTTFPAVDGATYAPYVPTFLTPTDASVKGPAWLNDPTMYHNRGNSDFQGESSLDGDFSGLDDLWTERPEVVAGMTQIYQAWVDFGVDGFRVDTVKHVNVEFWQQWSKAILDRARADGRTGFQMFGEVYSTDVQTESYYSTTAGLPSVLDFGFQSAAQKFVTGADASALAQLFATDDQFTDADSNAYSLVTFLGNHDMGRIGGQVLPAAQSPEEAVARDELAHSLLFLVRGQPCVYYGDEQGMVGQGGDKYARGDQFATQTAAYADDAVIGGTPGSTDRYDPAHPLYQHIAALSQLRRGNPALVDGAMVQRYAQGGLLVFSRIGSDGVEYLVALNNQRTDASASVPTGSPDAVFQGIFGAGGSVTAGASGEVALTVPALTAVVFKAGQANAATAGDLTLEAPDRLSGAAALTATWTGTGPAELTFLARPVGSSAWVTLGTDDNPLFSVSPRWTDLFPDGTLLELRAVAKGSDPTATAAVTAWVVRS